MPDKLFYTKTMARVYAKQGDLVRAARIYRYLLSETPGRRDLEQALAEVDRQIGDCQARDEHLRGLLGRWLALLLRANGMQKLNTLTKRR